MSSSASSYDEVPYESHPYRQAHPGRLFAVATLFGLTPPPIHQCRVLEIGCAAGGHLIPLAEEFPEARFVGIDLSARQIAEGQDLIDGLALANITLRHADLREIDDSYGLFDYVICHGVFSWVPCAVRDNILAICRRHLAPNGVAYISYNTFPGWHMRGMIRDMMRYHADRFESSGERVSQARSLIEFLAHTVKREGPYAALLHSELEGIRKQADHYLFHEHLESDNQPLYFHEFIDLVRKHGLGYLGESRIGTMIAANFGPDVEKMFAELSLDQIQTEQYLDFVRNRTFRETLLVPIEQEPKWEIDSTRLELLHISSDAKPVGRPRKESKVTPPQQFRSRSGMTISTTRPLVKAAMNLLAECWPGTIAFPELQARASEVVATQSESEDDANTLSFALLNIAISSELIEMSGVACTATSKVATKPLARRSARIRVIRGATAVANWRHELVHLNELEQFLLPQLDGTLDREKLLDLLVEQAQQGRFHVDRNRQAVGDVMELRTILSEHLDKALQSLAEQALFTS